VADLNKFDLIVLRYVPDNVKGEFLNIGVLMIDSAAGSEGFADVLFTRDWRRLRCLDPDADVEMLLAIENDLRTQLKESQDRTAFLGKLDSLLGNFVQMSVKGSCLAKDAAEEIRFQMHMLCESAKRTGARPSIGRQRILKIMQSALEQAGILGLMRKEIPAQQYTWPGDPLKIDFGYKPNGVLKMMHAVSLGRSVDPAKALAFTFTQMREGAAKLNLKLGLTAVVEDDLDRGDSEIGFGLAALERSDIRIAVAAEMPMIAEAARRELRA